jgi:hypothetical protein
MLPLFNYVLKCLFFVHEGEIFAKTLKIINFHKSGSEFLDDHVSHLLKTLHLYTVAILVVQNKIRMLPLFNYVLKCLFFFIAFHSKLYFSAMCVKHVLKRIRNATVWAHLNIRRHFDSLCTSSMPIVEGQTVTSRYFCHSFNRYVAVSLADTPI